jgi:peptidoglycan/LPS O-acetylase OafA/YrhL
MKGINKELVYLPGLNGIRTIAATGVMISHINLSLGKFNVNDYSLCIKRFFNYLFIIKRVSKNKYNKN